MQSIDTLEAQKQATQKRLMALQEEAAALRREIDNAKVQERVARADARDREADAHQKRREVAASKLEGVEGGIAELQQRLKGVDKEIAQVDEQIGDQEQYIDKLYAEVEKRVEAIAMGLGKLVIEHDPIGLQHLVHELNTVEKGNYLRRVGQQRVGNTSAEQVIFTYPMLAETLHVLRQFSLANGLPDLIQSR
jgi:DNA repair exonuclease SbcCD ATPase subunit